MLLELLLLLSELLLLLWLLLELVKLANVLELLLDDKDWLL